VSIDVTAEARIGRSPGDVAALMFDPARERDWIAGIKESRVITEPPFGIGSRVQRTAGFLGRRIEYLNEVTELEPGRCLDMRSVKAPFPMRITYSVERDGEGTVVRNRIRGGPPGALGRLAAPLLARMVKRNVTRDLHRLRDLLEAP
jgi:uncharacterized membrane protein